MPLTLDLPPEMRARLSEEAQRRNVTESAFVHAVVEKALADAEEPSWTKRSPWRNRVSPGWTSRRIRGE